VEVAEYTDRYWKPLNRFWRIMKLNLAHEPDVFRWKYLDAPAARAGARLFLVVVEEGEVVGTLGFTECPVYVHGQRLMSCAFNDWYIHPRLRGKRMGDRLMPYFTGRPAEVKLYFLSSPPSIKASLRHGFTELHGIAAYVEHLAYLAKARAAIHGAWRKVAGRPRRRRRMSPHLKRLEHLDPEVKVLEASERQVNELLARYQLQYPFACARSMEYLRWKYLEHPKDLGVLLQLTGEAGQLRAIFALAWRSAGISDALLLADVYYDRRRPQDLKRILRFHREAALVMRANSRSIYTGNRELTEAAQESGMTLAREHLNGFRDDSHIGLDPSTLPEWYTCGGDSDYVS